LRSRGIACDPRRKFFQFREKAIFSIRKDECGTGENPP
jgi:hypothetical protein